MLEPMGDSPAPPQRLLRASFDLGWGVGKVRVRKYHLQGFYWIPLQAQAGYNLVHQKRLHRNACEFQSPAYRRATLVNERAMLGSAG